MACPHCGNPDDTDRSAESHGLILRSVAARQARRSRTWVDSRIGSGELETAQFAGRVYVVARSLVRLLTIEGVPTNAEIELDRLIESNDVVAAQELHRQLYPQAWAGLMPPTQSAASPTELPDPWHDVVVRNLGRK